MKLKKSKAAIKADIEKAKKKFEKIVEKIIAKSQERQKARNKKFGRLKCNCGHYLKDHYLGEGCCEAKVKVGRRKMTCGCTWYWPNDKYIIRKSEEARDKKYAKMFKQVPKKYVGDCVDHYPGTPIYRKIFVSKETYRHAITKPHKYRIIKAPKGSMVEADDLIKKSRS